MRKTLTLIIAHLYCLQLWFILLSQSHIKTSKRPFGFGAVRNIYGSLSEGRGPEADKTNSFKSLFSKMLFFKFFFNFFFNSFKSLFSRMLYQTSGWRSNVCRLLSSGENDSNTIHPQHQVCAE